MRDFYKKQVLDRTYEIFGVRQTDEDKMSEDDIRFLLDGLCQVSKNYAYIPEEEQKKIISACMISDKTYRNINLRLVAGWLELNGKKYFVETAHKQTEITKPPLEGEERDKAIQNYLDALAKVNTEFSITEVKGRGAIMKENLEKAGMIHNPIPPEESALNDYCQQQVEEYEKTSTKETEA